ncbi:RcnB family protein [Massilia solisilvae]|uniref:RcnB family protein n=1 Tax=Massilia solisilvae TaxID=1811225 RepID=A0ABT2BI88_9BURK|nr:RcnB family protein [Massilia solisilvae]MCS0608230.1 RcnB family protein [Massilia solisilvae]
MSKKIFVPALVAAMLSSSVSVMAQERGYHNERDNSWQQRDERYQRNDERYERNDQRYQRDDDRDRRDARMRGDRRDERHDGARGGWGRTESFSSGYDGYGPDHDLHRGERLPSRYRTHQYVVDNWRAHHLTPPPRGHRWVQVGADYVLVAAATGLIVSAVSGQ